MTILRSTRLGVRLWHCALSEEVLDRANRRWEQDEVSNPRQEFERWVSCQLIPTHVS
ncbi:hypothetical protein BVRB_9g217880 [Beta vulgaris subsp. vulgaris]|nr:hypothetical protein BVRB_9g217880 [Beta vulgaris subsp. vulgaris]